MPFFRTLSVRAKEDELMDDFSMGGEELSEALKHLRRLNRIFAAPGPTRDGVQKLWQAIGQPQKLSILDVGAGSGDVNVKLLEWADRKGIELEITLVDMTEEACVEARKLFRHEPRVSVLRADLQELADASADIVTGSQFVHHFDGQQLVEMVDHMRRVSRYGVVINDIHRHPVSYTAVWVMTRMISRNRYIRHDGPLSVAKGFKGSDWQELKQRLQADAMTYTWKPLFRYSVVIPKQVISG
ncbi:MULTISPECIES: methyltransferase domain-containing protein [unclassified Paenibacillus]|uniref:methyltransferase domain-containing protein n=1 Tax=unclassified Paenibacillus TaxID=185978 RepID=UPI002404B259|nr:MULTISPECIES: methyltransferase domain-containing protein [unclassified Paenibacillus]MDF9839359.1 ubiquinone/menaquinone biosynthesis C-methylase UbiE [Paenibacillus sp. PastF-2]MDF9845940.1 ubiquinone/menaquinone biosynthesis C-methylase UbiE [Paenibacillus sp. PastM-2]MDF9852513.1 ubiquinone/menaquinone biosynthesis C-methylase UbiE [Paenibacillus sp. PastF-1]MDH6477757.1 ubiquinone/menaquinone biosynthesis C-methylase UbiE [Paenibacillus sp. PastH-2]MDH6505496.1 ubiquinone/menaquinone b